MEIPAEQANNPDDDQIDCHDVVEQPRDNQNQDPGNESRKGSDGEVQVQLTAFPEVNSFSRADWIRRP